MLKRKLKQWLGEHEPGVHVKMEPDVPWCSTPELPRSPSSSAVNRYPSMKTKLLGPKLEPPGSPDSAKENGDVNGSKGAYASEFKSTVNLAAAAAFATGLPCGKKMREQEKFKPSSPMKTTRVQAEASADGSERCESPKPNGRSKPPTPKPSRVKPSPAKPKPGNSYNSGPASSEETGEPKEETDEEVARRLHQEFNCAPVRQSRSRGGKLCAGEAAEDPVHGTDPGILPSC
ncbi:hypothetical protein N9L76_07640 [bacterium]|nr:hypothetical protein [bacterium]